MIVHAEYTGTDIDIERMAYQAKRTKSALSALQMYTPHFDIGALSGSMRASTRAAIMTELCGFKVPQAKAGVNALESLFYGVMGIKGDCMNTRQKNFRNKAIEILYE